MSDGMEPLEDALSDEALEMHRALRSLIEEIEAIDYYDERLDVSNDEALQSILAHNAREEKEHAAMLLEHEAGHVSTSSSPDGAGRSE